MLLHRGGCDDVSLHYRGSLSLCVHGSIAIGDKGRVARERRLGMEHTVCEHWYAPCVPNAVHMTLNRKYIQHMTML